MTRTHDLLTEAAEQLVRDEGLEALTIRALAARANYGKSTVHEAVGGTDGLVRGLRRRASDDMIAVVLGDDPPDVTSPAWRAEMYRRLSQWILENPSWFEVCFLKVRDSDNTEWIHPLAKVLVGAMPAGVGELDKADVTAIAHVSADTLSAVVQLVINVGDAEFGASVLCLAFTAIYDGLRELIDLRAPEVDLCET